MQHYPQIVVTSDLGRVTTYQSKFFYWVLIIVVTSDLGRVTTIQYMVLYSPQYCGDVRFRTSYNGASRVVLLSPGIVVTSDLGRVTTFTGSPDDNNARIVVTSDLGRVTTLLI